MARTGRFGRLPKAAPDLTSTIVSLLREYNAQVDSNYVDAWKNGGSVDGKAVTDSRLLAHMKGRRDQLDHNDPMWAQWDNRITQYQFSIEDSKMRVKYDNGKATDHDMAAFYQGWADKTPNNTEFDRTLLSAVGKFNAASAAKGRAGAAAAAASKFKGDITNIENNGPQQARDANDALLDFARNTGMIPTDSKSLADLDVSSGRAAELLDVLKDGVDNGNPAVKNQITILEGKLRKVDPKFTWANSQDWFNQIFEKGAKGDTRGLQYLKGSKFSSDAWNAHFSNDKANHQFTQTKLAGLGPSQDARTNSDWLDAQIAAAHGNPYLEQTAFAAYQARQNALIGQLQKAQVGQYQDPLLVGLINEQRNLYNAANGGTDKPQSDWRDSVTGATGQAAGQSSPSADRYALASSSKEGADILNNGGWLQVIPDPTDHTGTKAVYQVQPAGVPIGAGAVLMPGSGIPNSVGGTVSVYGVPEPVQIMVTDPTGTQLGIPSLKTDATGQAIPVLDASGKQALDATGRPKYEETGNDTGITVLRSIDSAGNGYFTYRTQAPDGTYILSETPPFKPGVSGEVRTGPNGQVIFQVRLDPTMVDPTTGKALPSAQPATLKSGGPGGGGAVGIPGTITTSGRGRPEQQFTGQPAGGGGGLSFAGLVGEAPPPAATGGRANPNLPLEQQPGWSTMTLSQRVGVASSWQAQGGPTKSVQAPTTTPTGTTAPGTAAPGTLAAMPTGGAAAYAVGGVPGYDATKYIDQTAVNVDPTTGQLHTGYYRSSLGLSIAHEFGILVPSDPNYKDRVVTLSGQVASGSATLTRMYQDAAARGNQAEMTNLSHELTLWTNDQANLQSVVRSAQTGTTNPGTRLTDPANPSNAGYNYQPYGTPATGGGLVITPDQRSKSMLNQSTDAFDQLVGASGVGVPKTGIGMTGLTTTGPTGLFGSVFGGAAARAAAGPRELKLPSTGLMAPFLQPLQNFVTGAQVPQLGIPGTPAQPPTIAGAPSGLTSPSAPASTPAAPTVPITTPPPPTTKPPAPPPTPLNITNTAPPYSATYSAHPDYLPKPY